MYQIAPGLAGLLLLVATHAMAAGPKPSVDLATCTRSATLLACKDGKGNDYSVATLPNGLALRGYESAQRRRWVQTNTRSGSLTFFTGMASDGEVWIGAIQRVGWTTVTWLSSSNGTRSRVTCSRLGGCR
jgi:hypothetical protein